MKVPAAPFVLPRATAQSLLGASAPPHLGDGPPGFGKSPQLFHEPGTDIVRQFQHPSFTTFEESYKVLPEDAWFAPQVSPTRPVQFQLGAFQVPKNMHLWVMDYEFKIYRQSGLDPGDAIPAEAGRFSGVMGFDITVSGKRLSHLLYQLDPVPVQINPQTFDRPPGTRANASQFNRASAQSFAAAASPGLSLLPVRRERQGSTVSPFTMIARPTDSVGLSCVIFKTVTSPITAIEGRMVGYLLQHNMAHSLIERLRPR